MPRKRKQGRPKKNPAERKSERIQISATPEQAEALREAAEFAGISLGPWVLQEALKAARRLQR